MAACEAALRFLVDHMLIKLAKYLRIVGLDAAYVPGERTHEVVRRANAETRVFLTRNTRLSEQSPPPDRAFQIAPGDPVDQLHAVLDAYGIDPYERLFSRCIRCNRELEELGELGPFAKEVPERVRERHRRFWTCSLCGTVFWRGTHVENTLRKLRLRGEGPA